MAILGVNVVVPEEVTTQAIGSVFFLTVLQPISILIKPIRIEAPILLCNHPIRKVIRARLIRSPE
jgi:hypothetical protein